MLQFPYSYAQESQEKDLEMRLCLCTLLAWLSIGEISVRILMDEHKVFFLKLGHTIHALCQLYHIDYCTTGLDEDILVAVMTPVKSCNCHCFVIVVKKIS